MNGWCLLLLVAVSASGAEPDLRVESAKISRSANALMTAGRTFALASDRLQTDERGSIDGELKGLGGALGDVAESLRILEPMLLVRQPVGFREIVEPTPAGDAALKENFRLVLGFRAAVAQISAAGKMLAAREAGGEQTLIAAGQALIDLKEQSGIGLYLQFLGQQIDEFRAATLRHDYALRARTTRVMGLLAAAAAETLAGSATVIVELDATLRIGASLIQISGAMKNPPLDLLEDSLDSFHDSLLQFSGTLSRRAVILRSIDPPKESVEAVAFLERAAMSLDDGAQKVASTAAHLDEARRAIASGRGDEPSLPRLGGAMRSAGRILKDFGVTSGVVLAGETLLSAGELLEAGRTESAAAVLKSAGIEVMGHEKPLILGMR
jgi:hypothetical protein